MNDYSRQNIANYFSSISPWRAAYGSAQLNYVGVRRNGLLHLLSARIYLGVKSNSTLKKRFQDDDIEAGQWAIPKNKLSVEQVVEALLSTDGLKIEGHGQLLLAVTNAEQEISASTPMLLHPEGLETGDRLCVISINGANHQSYLNQPNTDWLLKAAGIPYDNISELTTEYGLGTFRGSVSLLEVVSYAAVQVLAGSSVKAKTLSFGLWLPKGLKKSHAHIGYRVLEKGIVVLRGSILGNQLTWEKTQDASIGRANLEIPLGAVVQCIASYAGQAHQIRWFADPAIFFNPRAAVLSLVDQANSSLRGYLSPEPPLRGIVADNFEEAVGWMLWALGFAPATFGTNNKTKDAFDIVAVTPNGDFLVVECTLGLLRAEGKLSKLSARTARVREQLNLSNMRHLRVLPVIVTAMTKDEVKADLSQATEAGVVVLTKENLDKSFDELLRFPDANALFERAHQTLQPSGFVGLS